MNSDLLVAAQCICYSRAVGDTKLNNQSRKLLIDRLFTERTEKVSFGSQQTLKTKNTIEKIEQHWGSRE